MRRACLVLAAAALGAAMAGQAQAATCPKADPDAVAAALRAMYVAAATDDEAGFKAVFAPDFYAFDGGRRFDGMGLAELIKGAHKSGAIFQWQVTEPVVHFACDTAWITYVNRGAVGDASGTRPMTWLESAILKYDGARWRIQFFHSTRAPAGG